jgi:hypothetical protein
VVTNVVSENAPSRDVGLEVDVLGLSPFNFVVVIFDVDIVFDVGGHGEIREKREEGGTGGLETDPGGVSQ